ncbi:hypothetical protein GWK47_015902 [Chionoecetes opilio]|uniref:Secreted protein n=1 Tax=Chionoecetes opilio TaxID=41210 RepID=A0A8J4XWW0_CHIOP|nr:hypothetical protein GWK47_015902 [Chionoecetes opilio]
MSAPFCTTVSLQTIFLSWWILKLMGSRSDHMSGRIMRQGLSGIFGDKRKERGYGRVVTELLSGIAIDPVRVCCFSRMHVWTVGTITNQAFHRRFLECMCVLARMYLVFAGREGKGGTQRNEFVLRRTVSGGSFLLVERGGGPVGATGWRIGHQARLSCFLRLLSHMSTSFVPSPWLTSCIVIL